MLTAAALLAGSAALVGGPAAHADPLTPAEGAYLNDEHHWRPIAQMPNKTDAQLLDDGWYACHLHATGQSPPAAGIDPVIVTYAYLDLCPKGCPPPRGCHYGMSFLQKSPSLRRNTTQVIETGLQLGD